MTQPSLREVQRWMISRILPPERAADAVGEVALNPQAGEPGAERLSVYSGGYLARIEEALEEAYPAVRHVAGAGSFRALARDYAARHPSRDYNLSLVGRHLPEFLKTHELTNELAFLPDLARLEWQVVEAFHAFDQAPTDTSGLAAVPPEEWTQTRLVFQPSVRLVDSAWPILDIWEARVRPVAEVRIDLVNRPQKILVFRSGLQVRCELLQKAQFRLLEELLAGRTLGQACACLPEDSPEEEPPLADWFSRWAASGLVVNINPA